MSVDDRDARRFGNFFDKVYIINLKRSPDRKNNMIEQLNKYNITNYFFIDTIDGQDVDTEDLKRTKKWAYPNNDFCSNGCSCRGKGHSLSNAQLSVHINHYNIWQNMIENKYNNCLILEDDCVFTDEAFNFDKIVDYIPKDWQILFLGHVHRIGSGNSIEINDKFWKVTKHIPESHIYGITRECAELLVKNAYPLRAAVDGYLSHFMINNKVINNAYVSKTNYGLNGSLQKIYKTTIK